MKNTIGIFNIRIAVEKKWMVSLESQNPKCSDSFENLAPEWTRKSRGNRVKSLSPYLFEFFHYAHCEIVCAENKNKPNIGILMNPEFIYVWVFVCAKCLKIVLYEFTTINNVFSHLKIKHIPWFCYSVALLYWFAIIKWLVHAQNGVCS